VLDMQDILTRTLGSGIEVRVAMQTQLRRLFADKAQLETVLINFATNARDAMDGNGTLVLGAANETITVAERDKTADALAAGDYVCLSISDTGVGMNAATLARAQEPFFTTKPLNRGTGLGLSMAAGFAAQSLGRLQIDSAPGRGTAVRLWLPSVGPDPELTDRAASIPLQSSEAEHLRGRLLLVDDDVILRTVIAKQMEKEGYAVQTAETAAAALSLLKIDPGINLLISDFSMPGMDGLRLIAEAQHLRPNLPAILLTGVADQLGSRTETGYTLLRKPIHGKDLSEQIATHLNRTLGRPAAIH